MNTDWREYVSWTDNEIKGFFGKDEYRWLSNFEQSDVWFEGALYPTAEHAYMASKTELHRERTPLIKVEDIIGKHVGLSAFGAKEYGQTVTLRPNWDAVKFDYMLGVVFNKFLINIELRKKLLATGDKYLEETNHWHDNFYGVCCCPECVDKHKGNNLGKILMKVREIFK